jgi:hypothetical protein
MSSESQLGHYNAGANGGLYTGSTPEDHAAYQAGAASRGGGSAGPGAGMGIVALPLLILTMLPALVIGTCLFPLAGILTLVGCSLIAGLLADNVAFMMMLIVVLLPGIIMFVLGLKLEAVLEAHRWYRATRHAARIMVVGFVAHVFAFALFSNAGHNPHNQFWLDRVTLPHVIMVIAAMVGGHFLSRWLDRRFGTAASFGRRFSLRRAKPV